MRRDKPAVGLHQHTRLAKASRVTDGPSSGGAQWEWERAAQTSVGGGGGVGGAGGLLLICLQPACWCPPSVSVTHHPPVRRTQANKHPERAALQLQLPTWVRLMTRLHHSGTRAAAAEQNRSRPCRDEEWGGREAGPAPSCLSHCCPHYRGSSSHRETSLCCPPPHPPQSEWMNLIFNTTPHPTPPPPCEKCPCEKNVAAVLMLHLLDKTPQR